MKNISVTLFTLILFLFIIHIWSIKFYNHQSFNISTNYQIQNSNHTENLNNSQCTKQFCISKFGLMVDPLNPMCDQNATCWKDFYGFPQCSDNDTQCWKKSVGYPKNCTDDDYDCWIKYFGFVHCDDVDCLKKQLNYTCKYDDFQCWKNKNLIKTCKWNDWDCWLKDTIIGLFCQQGEKPFNCMQKFYDVKCKQDDESCWRNKQMLPSAECQANLQCYKKFYYLPNCKDDDLKCWKKLYWGPNCKRGDMECLKKYLFIPDCSKQPDQILCYKKWHGYPDCKSDDGKCWKDYNKLPFMYRTTTLLIMSDDSRSKNIEETKDKQKNRMSYDGHLTMQPGMSFGKLMQHKRQNMAQNHKLMKQFHMKRFTLTQ